MSRSSRIMNQRTGASPNFDNFPRGVLPSHRFSSSLLALPWNEVFIRKIFIQNIWNNFSNFKARWCSFRMNKYAALKKVRNWHGIATNSNLFPGMWRSKVMHIIANKHQANRMIQLQINRITKKWCTTEKSETDTYKEKRNLSVILFSSKLRRCKPSVVSNHQILFLPSLNQHSASLQITSNGSPVQRSASW